ncbi:TonB-dependent receptor [Bacteroidetes/Chlorobi group bacterium Naka2016]|nr:MAG: TonB-dependent receptor [Bacteroidetes/Chlorobi group bacterium Naka2016]
MRKIILMINILLINSVYLAFTKEVVNLIFKIYDSHRKPIPYCQIYLTELKQVLFSNKDGIASTKINFTDKINVKFEKFFYETLDTTITLLPQKNTIELDIFLKEKEFHSNEVVVTATRTEKDLFNITLPMSTIVKEEITLVNAKKLDEMLLELTDIPIVDDHGRGIQLQGLDPDYTLLLVNGEPMVNRTGGILDISRLSVGNVSRIEIVKGPNSSLYGSNALAGVINIITSEPEKETEFNIYSRYGTYNSLDLIGEYKQILFNDFLSFSTFLHRFKTDGYSLLKNSVGKTVPEITNHTFHFETFLNLTPRSKIRLAFKANLEDELNYYLANYDTVRSKNNVDDLSSYLFYKNTLNDRFNYEFRTYFSSFSTNTVDKFTKIDSLYDEYKFSQSLFKAELQTNYVIASNNYATFGGGYWREEAKSVRIAGGKESNRLFYVYLQDDITLFEKLNLIGSLRIDDHSEYPLNFTPKFSASYQALPKLVIRGSVGTGFKAPNFEELYLDWSNPMAGYSVFGRTYIVEGLRKLLAQGQIASLLISPDTLPSLEPEKSLSFDFGGNFSTEELFVKINIFRNNVTNLIDFLPVAIKTNGQRLHTYQNIRRIYTQGVELSFEYKFLNYFKVNVSYQFLETGDLDVIDKIKNKKIFKRDPKGFDVPVQLKDYGGLFHRPRHSGNIRLSYFNENLKLFTSLRVNVKSKYGYKDINGNLILDDTREYAPGYAIFNWNISKDFFKYFTASFGVNNIFDKKDIRLLASNPGRTFYFSLNLNYFK